jgi:hypothetical protein
VLFYLCCMRNVKGARDITVPPTCSLVHGVRRHWASKIRRKGQRQKQKKSLQCINKDDYIYCVWTMCPFHGWQGGNKQLLWEPPTDTFTFFFTFLPPSFSEPSSFSSPPPLEPKIHPPRSSSSYVHLHAPMSTAIPPTSTTTTTTCDIYWRRRCPNQGGKPHTHTHTQATTESNIKMKHQKHQHHTLNSPSSLRPSFCPPPSPPQDKHAGIIKVRHVLLCVPLCVYV